MVTDYKRESPTDLPGCHYGYPAQNVRFSVTNMRPLPNQFPRVALLLETTRSYSRDLLRGIRRYIAAHGPWSTFLELRAQDSSPPSWLRHWDGDGLLTRTFNSEIAEIVTASGIPCVELRSTHSPQGRLFVGMDNTKIGAMVAEHFLERGYRKFAVFGLGNERFFVERVSNFMSAVAAHGFDCLRLDAPAEGQQPAWEEYLTQLIQWVGSLPKPIAVFAVNDSLGAHLLEACLRAGISVPEDVAVVGTENDETLCAFATPPLSSVQLSGVEVGFTAAQLLDQIMRGETPQTMEILLPPKGIVVRRSSDQFVIADRLVADAARLIRDFAPLGMNVNELCQRLNTSRSTLERRMGAVFKRSPKEEIQRVRFREVERLLSQTDNTIETIAAQTGFPHCHYLQSAFKSTYGITPGTFRKRAAQNP